MSTYRRNHPAGGTAFFTVNLADRRFDLLTRVVNHRHDCVARTRARYPFALDVWVVLPDHLHAIWTLPAGDAEFSVRWWLIERYFSGALPCGGAISPSCAAQGERGIWQRRFWEHAIGDAADISAHMDYVHFHPVKHGLAAQAAEWPFFSFHRALARGD